MTFDFFKGGQSNSTNYFIKHVMPNEFNSLGGDTISIEPVYRIAQGDYVSMNLDFRLRESFINCSTTQKVISPCIKAYFDTKHGMNLFDKAMDLETNKMRGLDNLREVTNCSKSCFKTEYVTKLLVTKKVSEIPFTIGAKNHLKDKGFDLEKTAIVEINHIKASLSKQKSNPN